MFLENICLLVGNACLFLENVCLLVGNTRLFLENVCLLVGMHASFLKMYAFCWEILDKIVCILCTFRAFLSETRYIFIKKCVVLIENAYILCVENHDFQIKFRKTQRN